MKHRKSVYILIGTLAVLATLGAFLGFSVETRGKENAKKYTNLYAGAMHPWIISEGPGECELCGMSLSKVEGHQPGTVFPGVDNIFISPSNPMYLHEGPGKDPETGEALIPVKKSPYYEEPSKEEQEHSDEMHDHEMDMQNGEMSDMEQAGSDKQLYTCGMHPDVIQDEPGNCPICGMNLTPLKGSTSGNQSGEREIAYWVAPMDPSFVSDSPGKSPMGMDLVPVYKDQLSQGAVKIDPVTIQSIGVRTETVERRNLAKKIRSNGVLKAAEDKEFKVNSRISGWIEKLNVDRTGDPVSEGQVLLELYSPELVAVQEEFLIALENRVSKPGENGIDYLEAARQRLRLWDISESQIERLEKEQKVRKTLELISPHDGIVLHKNVVEGDAVKRGMDLFRIADLDTVWVIAQVYEDELPWISPGDHAEIRSPYDPSISVDAKVSYIYPTLDPRTRTAEVRLILPNRNLEFKPEMYVDVVLKTSPKTDVIALPKSSVIRSGERDIVFVQRGKGLFEPVEIILGLETDRYYEVSSGLHGNEEVVVSAQFLLDSEAKLQEAIQRRIAQRKKMESASMQTQ